ncbi:MAG: ABC transporter ATP-binding protein [Acidobacteria bacterium]|nr:ABC transporter ATP-binding protein [Acidobacteriota bacterium]
MALLEVHRLSKAFGGLTALRAVSFTVAERELLGVIGPNGSGKSTLFHIIGGVLRPSSGTVAFAGETITGRQPWEICRLGIGRTPQIPMVFPGLTCLENVLVGAAFGSRRRRLPVARARHEAIAALETVGLADLAARPAPRLSLGQTRLLELAMALASAPRLLLLDEPTAGLSPAAVQRVLQLLRGLRGRGVTIVLVDHKLRAIADVASRLLALDRGEVIAEGPSAEVTRHPRVLEAYLGEP